MLVWQMLHQKDVLLPHQQLLSLKWCQLCQPFRANSSFRSIIRRRGRASAQSSDQASKELSQVAGMPQESKELSSVAAVPTWPGSPVLFLTAIGGLLAIVTDLFAPFGDRLAFHNIDQPTHAWVVANVPPILRDLVFEIGFSNITILLASAAWALVTGILLSDANNDMRGCTAGTRSAADDSSAAESSRTAFLKVRALRRLAVAWILYIAAGGFVIPGDNLLVRWLKHACMRARPSTLHKSFSFPSGHTTAVTFLTGTLLLILLPALLDLMDARSRGPNAAARQGVLKSEALQRLARSAVESGGKLWMSAAVSTAAGRVLGDVHWVTDTAAGACLGIALVSGFLLVSKWLDQSVAEN